MSLQLHIIKKHTPDSTYYNNWILLHMVSFVQPAFETWRDEMFFNVYGTHSAVQQLSGFSQWTDYTFHPCSSSFVAKPEGHRGKPCYRTVSVSDNVTCDVFNKA